MLTLKDLKVMQPGVFFRSGYFTKDGIKFRWVAIRGDIWDWAIYYHIKGKPDRWIVAYGDKITNKEVIRNLLPCNDEAFEMYRY